MALDKQSVSISFNKGVDTKTDSKQVVPGKLLNLENVILKKVGKFVKRNGYGVIAANAPIVNGNALATFKNELLAFNGSTISSYSSSDDKLYSKGAKVAVDLSVQSIARNSYEQTNPDCAIHSVGISVYAWQDSSGGVRYSVFDTVTQQAIVSNALVSATGSKPKVKTIGTNILIFYIDGVNLNYYKINSASPSTVYSPVTLATIGSYTSGNFYDVSLINSKILVAYSGPTTTGIFSLDSALVQSATTVVSEASSCLSIFGDTSNNVWVAYKSGVNLKVFIRNNALTGVVLAPTVVATESFVISITNVTGIYDGTGKIYFEVLGTAIYGNYIKYVTCSVAGSVSTPSVLLRSVGLYSKPFIVSGSVYLIATHDSDLQPTYFVINGSGSVITKIAQDLGGGYSTSGLLAEVNLLSTNNYLFAYEYKDFVQSVAGDVTTQTGINSATLTFAAPIVSSELGNNLHTSGGLISSYDGQNINELGFNLYPEQVTPGYSQNGGYLEQGSYKYSSTYEWTDSQGQIHRSAPKDQVLTINQTNQFFEFIGMGASSPALRLVGDPSNPLYTGDLDETLQKVCIGKRINTSFTTNAYVISIVDLRIGSLYVYNEVYIILDQSFSTSAGSRQVAYTSPETVFKAKTSLGYPTIEYKDTSSNCYFGSCSSGSNTIYMANTKGLIKGMRLLSSVAGFPVSASSVITNVYSDRVEMATTSTKNVDNGIFYFTKSFKYNLGIVSSITWNETIQGPMDMIVGQGVFIISDGTVFGNPIVTISTITNLGGGVYTIQFSAGIQTNFVLAFGQYPNQGLYSGQTVNASAYFTNPVTINFTQDNVNQINNKIVFVNKPASNTGDITVTISQFALPTIYVDTLRVTDKQNAVINLYRTVKNGTISYQVTPIGGIPNNKSVDFISFIDTTPDEFLPGNAQLYTTGGEVENIAPPASNIVTMYKNRLLVVPNEDPISFWYSKQVRSNTPIEFNDFFVQRVSEKGGPITALQQMDDKLLIFKQDYIYVMVGDGPSVSGINNDFTDPQLITADCGCRDKKSVIVLPIGVIYLSQKGYYLLDRALNVKYIGADVEAYNSYTVNSAKMVETENQVRFNLSSGDTLVYDYYVEQWNVFKNINAVDAVNFQDRYTYLLSNGQIRRETPNTFLDNTSFIPMKIESGWISMAGLQGFQRLYQFLIIGTYKSPHTLQVELYRDFVETPYQTTTIPVLTDPGKYQFRIYPSIQKCEAFKIKITELQDAPYGEGCDITAIALEIGAKKGQNKIPATESYG